MSDNVTLTSSANLKKYIYIHIYISRNIFPQMTSLISLSGAVRCYVKQTHTNKQTYVWNNEVDVLNNNFNASTK